MIHIDGSLYSGSGTILRYSIALCAILGEELQIVNIRAKRDKPGLRPQHLKSILACCELCEGKIDGAEVGSKEIFFKPGEVLKGGGFQWDIGTAGSTTMLIMTVLPMAIFSEQSSTFVVKGGLFQDYAPSAFHMKEALFKTLEKMGVKLNLQIVKPGYVPKGNGIIQVEVFPAESSLKPLNLVSQGKLLNTKVIALESHLRPQKVSERMISSCVNVLRRKGINSRIEEIHDKTSAQKGAALFLYGETDSGCLFGSDMAGKIGRSSEEIGKKVANFFLEDLQYGSTVDRHLADQIILYAALAEGTTVYKVPSMTDHVKTNLWLIEKILKANVVIEGHWIKIRGIGYKR